jgi:hypothetical protein
MHHVITQIQEAVKIQKLILSFSHDITKAAQWHGLGDILSNGLAPAEWQKNSSHTHRRITGGVCGKWYLQRGILLTHSCEAWL